MLEYEKKILLTEDEYNVIITLIKKSASVKTQTNYYFDTDDFFMNKKGITCRIRAKNGKYKTTVKKHDAVHTERSIEEDLAEKAEFDFKIFNALGLNYQGELTTDRIVLYRDKLCEMVVDKNTYLGHADFELEVEYCKLSEPRTKTLLKNIAESLIAAEQLKDVDEFLARVGQGGSKSQRFFERKMKER